MTSLALPWVGSGSIRTIPARFRSRTISAIDCLVIPACAAITEIRPPSPGRVANTALCVARMSGNPAAAAARVMSCTRAW